MAKKIPTLTLLSIFFALFLWVLAVLEKEHNIKIKSQLKILKIPENLFLLKQTPNELNLQIIGKGRDLVKNWRYLKEYYLDFDELFENPIQKFPARFRLYLDLKKIKEIKELQLLTYSPNYLDLVIDIEGEKEVLIRPVFKEESEDYFLIKTADKKIKVFGPQSELIFLKEIYTESLNLKKLKLQYLSDKNCYYASQTVRLLNPDKRYFRLEKEEIPIEFYFTKIIEKEFKEIPVRLITNSQTKITPTHCQIVVKGAENILDTLQDKNIKVIIDVRNLKRGEYNLPAEILLPREITLIKCWPEKFKVEKF
uniref:YbbR-like domain-containing protein n=1 Tax=candidate division WOR-3 bacterium TaxID=2052148 RepID=A0A7V4E2E0_UNCW3